MIHRGRGLLHLINVSMFIFSVPAWEYPNSYLANTLQSHSEVRLRLAATSFNVQEEVWRAMGYVEINIYCSTHCNHVTINWPWNFYSILQKEKENSNYTIYREIISLYIYRCYFLVLQFKTRWFQKLLKISRFQVTHFFVTLHLEGVPKNVQLL